MRRFAVTLLFSASPPYTATIEADSPAHCLRYVAEEMLAAITARVVQIEVVEMP